MFKTLCIGGAAIGTIWGARRVARIVYEPRSIVCNPVADLPIKDLQRSVTLAYLAYQDPIDIHKRLMRGEIEREHECVGDVCAGAIESKMREEGGVVLPFFFDGRPNEDAQAFLWKAGRSVFIAFRGTEDMRDAMADLDVRRADLEDTDVSGVKLHNGFYKQYKSIDQDIMVILDELDSEYDEIVMCGHSLGAALATIAAADIATKKREKKVRCHTCGSPRVGNREFTEWFESRVSENWRIYNKNDPVPMIPISHRFVHVPNAVRISDEGEFRIVKGDMPWFVRPVSAVFNLDFMKPICDHDCKLYIARLMK